MLSIPEDRFLSLIEEMEECTLCDLANNRTNVVPYRGTPYTDVMVVAEAPGGEEDKLGKAMVGRSGYFFVSLMSRFGYPITSIYITNTVLCRPPNNNNPTSNQLTSCSYWLQKQIEYIQPKVIIAVGRFSVLRLIPDELPKNFKITEMEGKIFHAIQFNNIPVIPVRHPSAILRNPVKTPEYETAVKSICTIITDLIK